MAVTVESCLRGGTYFWGAPTYDQVRVAWDETRRAAGGVADFNVSRMEATFPTGGKIIYRSLDDPDNARSHTADGVVIDECGDVAAAAWYEVLRPMLIDTNGWLWAVGTPKGQNWFCTEWHRAKDRSDSASWSAPTLGCEIVGGKLVRKPHPLENPNIPFSELLDMFHTTPQRVFEQEVIAAFVENAGGVFRGVREVIDKERIENEACKSSEKYCAGVDLARVEDFTVITVLDSQKRQVYFERFNQISWERQIEAIKRVADSYKCPVVLDCTGVGDPIYEALRTRDVKVTPFQFTNSSKEMLINGLALDIEQKEIALMDIAVQTGELMAYQYELTPSRNVRMNAPPGGHDDTVIALGLARHGAVIPASETYQTRFR